MLPGLRLGLWGGECLVSEKVPEVACSGDGFRLLNGAEALRIELTNDANVTV